ncbi:hypothetical protein NJL88_27690 [Streptomyces sp. DK15]|uniref:hypothetical protein n=1 Tax=Streptomyces sp. DK15 TaxID=2957499 RepID=UPI0029A14822|nr:hypothetical protein [Streptomyces sp. DK15]MDX2393776.1 hypothetical protein [Streptomyces sp. DK15]
MLWIYMPGRGWVLQSPAPAFQGCVITPAIPRPFGLTTMSRLLGVLVVLPALGWMWADGHHLEVLGAIAAALLVDILREPVLAFFKTLRCIPGLRLRDGDA